MRTKVKLIGLHEPLFLAGTNFGQKLEPKSSKGQLELYHESESDHVIVEFKGETAHIKNWAYFNVDNGKVETRINPHQDRVVPPPRAQIGGPSDVFKAQVETPTTKVIRRPGRPPKYQGESVD